MRIRVHHHRRRSAAGFTLVEMIIVMVIITILAGVAVPVAGQAINREAQKATEAELKGFDEAVRQYFSDTGALPVGASALTTDNAVPGWSGPYMSGAIQDSASADFDQDGWGVAYTQTIVGDVWSLRSGGRDRTMNTADDVVLTVDITPQRREITMERLQVINLAIRLYNEDWQSPPPPAVADPLSTSWPTAFTQLVSRGYLPNSPQYLTDGWGADFQRVGVSGPVVAVSSPNLGT